MAKHLALFTEYWGMSGWRQWLAGLGGSVREQAKTGSPVVIWIDACLEGFADRGEAQADLILVPPWEARRLFVETVQGWSWVDRIVLEQEKGDAVLSRCFDPQGRTSRILWSGDPGYREHEALPPGLQLRSSFRG